MASADFELSIYSHKGLLRDLVPIYSLYQLAVNVVALGLVLWLTLWLGHFPPVLTLAIMLGWVFQFVSRPSEMAITKEQAAWLEDVLEAQGFYSKTDTDGRWRLGGAAWWKPWPHFFIEFVPGAAVTVIAPRDVMESLRDSLELLAEQDELLFAPQAEPFAFKPAEQEADVHQPWHTKVPTAVLGTTCVVTFLWFIVTGGVKSMGQWGLSSAALAEGRFETIFLHMFVHGSGMHLAMNMTALAGIGPLLTSRLGRPPLSWLRFLMLFFLSGLAGGALYLTLHPIGMVPMVGASGALYGLVGLLIRTPGDDGGVLAVQSRRVRRVGLELVKQNAFLFALLAVMAWTNGTNGGLAWEAHLGGFLFGLFIGPKLLPRTTPITPDRDPASRTFAPES